MSFGIDFGSILGAFWRYFPCLFAIDFRMNFRWHFLQILVPIRGDTLRRFGVENRHFFDPVPRGVFLRVPWLTLGSLCLPLGSLRLPFRSPWLPFGSLLVPLGSLSDPFLSLRLALAPLRLRCPTFGPYACESFSKNMFLGTRDRESTADSRWHPRRSNLSF